MLKIAKFSFVLLLTCSFFIATPSKTQASCWKSGTLDSIGPIVVCIGPALNCAYACPEQ